MNLPATTPGAARNDVRAALARVTAALPAGEDRTEQTAMADAVAAAVANRRHLVVQAGTGTGKSIGYLVPAILSDATVVVATATKALQDQLAHKDLPFLQQHLDKSFTFAVLKGRSNYFCLQKAAELRSSSSGQLELGDAADGARRKDQLLDEVTRIATWAADTIVGDRAELDFEPSAAAWGAVSVSAGECPGAAKCPMGEPCFAEKARGLAAASNVIVVNTHLYGQHVRSGGFILPEHELLIIDEAHEMEDIIADQLGVDVASSRYAFLAGRLRQVIVGGDEEARLAQAGLALDAALGPLAATRLNAGPAADERLRSALLEGTNSVQRALSLLRDVADTAPGVGPRKQRAMQAANSLLEDLQFALELGAQTNTPKTVRGTKPSESDDANNDTDADTDDGALSIHVAWVEAASRTRPPVLRIAPIDVAPSLAAAAWADRSAILTSATIPSNLIDRIGLPRETTDTLNVGSPFDYATQALLYCATHLPDPRSPAFEAAMHDELEALLRAAGGRTLALFTSWRAMESAAAAIRARDLDYRILTQSELPKPALTKVFREDETSCLFATMGFWQGVDVPGRELSIVVIYKLPFARPDEPLMMARRDRLGDDAFRLLDLPRAAMLLAQGAGRLIRTRTDRGVVAVLDPRLNSAKSYRNELLAALPPMRRTRHRADVESFLNTI